MSIYDVPVNNLAGEPASLAEYKGKALLIVNVASQCGLTPQYAGLEKLHEEYGPKGFEVLGFPCNQFGGQEPGTSDEIKTFCETNYGVEFPMLAKTVVKGAGQCDLYKYLASRDTDPKFGGPIKWNFTKFLISRKGEVVNRFEPGVKPDDKKVTSAIEGELKKK